MDNTFFLKSHVDNLSKVLDHADKLINPHQSLVDMTKRIVNSYYSLSEKEKKNLGMVYRTSILTLVKRSIAKIERMEGNNLQMKAQSLSLKNMDLETIFLQ